MRGIRPADQEPAGPRQRSAFRIGRKPRCRQTPVTSESYGTSTRRQCERPHPPGTPDSTASQVSIGPPTQAPCRRRPPGTGPPTGPSPMPRTRQPARTHPPTSPRLSASTGCGPGSSRATNRSRTNSAGPTFRSAPTARSAVTRPWSTAPSPSAGTSGSPRPGPGATAPDPAPMTGQRGGTTTPHQPPTALPTAGLAGRPLLAHPGQHPDPAWRAWTDQDPPPDSTPSSTRSPPADPQRFLRGRSDSNPTSKSRTRNRGSTRANRPPVRDIRTSNASCQRAGSTL